MVAAAQCRCGICSVPFALSTLESLDIDHMVPGNAADHQDDKYRTARRTETPALMLRRYPVPPEMTYTCVVHQDCNKSAAAEWNSRPNL